MRPSGSNFFDCPNPKQNRVLTRLKLGFSHPHKYKYSFQESLNPICSCGKDIISQLISSFTVLITQMRDHFPEYHVLY